MTEIRKPAVRIEQGKRTLFLSSFTVGDFMTKGFYRVDQLDVKGESGMQRLLDAPRARSFARDLVGAHEHNEEFLPTSVFLATEGSVGFDAGAGEIRFSVASSVCPFDVVDGQHRIEGLKIAAEKERKFLDFPVPVVIAHEMSEAEKMLHFLVVNTKQRPVNSGVTQFITAQFTRMKELQKLPYIPSWLDNQAEKGHDDLAIRLAQEFNEDRDSPWYGRIKFSDEHKSARHSITQETFVKSVKRELLVRTHPLLLFTDVNKRNGILRNYWIAVNRICGGADPEQETALVKYVGVVFFHSVLAAVLNIAAAGRDYSVERFEVILKSAENYLSPDTTVILTPEFWHTGGGVGDYNRAGLARLATDFTAALTKAQDDNIQL